MENLCFSLPRGESEVEKEDALGEAGGLMMTWATAAEHVDYGAASGRTDARIDSFQLLNAVAVKGANSYWAYIV